MEHDATLARTGSAATFGVAIAYVASGLFAVLMPPELQGRSDISQHQFWLVLSHDPLAHLGFHWSWIAAGMCGLAAVPTISLLVWRAHRGAVLWSGAAAFLGFAVLARSHLMEVAFDRRIIARYPQADPAFQQAVHVVAGLALDVPNGFLTYGAIGIWAIVVSWLARRNRTLPAPIYFLGFAAGFTYFAGLLGYTFAVHSLLVVGVGVGGLIVLPAWYAALGWVLWSRARSPA